MVNALNNLLELGLHTDRNKQTVITTQNIPMNNLEINSPAGLNMDFDTDDDGDDDDDYNDINKSYEKRSNENKITINKFIEISNKVHSNKYNYSLVKLEKISDNVKIICKKHGRFIKRAKLHMTGAGCNKCINEKRFKKSWKMSINFICNDTLSVNENNLSINKFKISNTQEWIEKAKIVHGDRYDYSKSVYANVAEKILINCRVHGDFYQIAINHIQGENCDKCNINKKIKIALKNLIKSNL